MQAEESSNVFYKVRCKCKNEQIIFSRPSTEVRCLVCGEILAKPTGGEGEIIAEIIEELR